MNKIIITGHLCKDIELRYTTNNLPVIQNTVAVRNDFKGTDGEYHTEFINIVVWRQTAEYLSKYAKKGSKVLVEGRLTNREYTKQDGTRGYITEIQTEKLEVLSSLIGTSQGSAETPRTNQPKTYIKQQDIESDPFAEFGNEIEVQQNELPF